MARESWRPYPTLQGHAAWSALLADVRAELLAEGERALHNHNDVGHFIVFADGRPVFADAGVQTNFRRVFEAVLK